MGVLAGYHMTNLLDWRSSATRILERFIEAMSDADEDMLSPQQRADIDEARRLVAEAKEKC